MKVKELRSLVNSGKTVLIEFTKNIEELEMRWNEGMKAYVTAIGESEDGCSVVRVDEREFEEYNKQIEKPYWRKEFGGEYKYKWSELNEPHTHDSDYDFYENDENDELWNIKVVDDERLKLFKQYKAEDIKLSYVDWLENKLLNSN